METRVLLEDSEFIFVVEISTSILYIWECTVLNIKKYDFWYFFCEIDIQKA